MSTDPSESHFDPLLALYTDSDEPTLPDVKAFDNIAMFEGNLRRQQLNKSAQEVQGASKKSTKSFSKRKKVQEEAKNRDVRRLEEFMDMRKKMDRGEDLDSEEAPEELPGTSGRKKVKKNLLTSMERLSFGPLCLLHNIVREHLRCNVYVRDFCGLRGVCIGYVVAFDRYTNLAMVDIDETFRKPPIGKVAEHQKQLSVSTLEEAVKGLSLGKEPTAPVKSNRKAYHHMTTSGVQIRRPKTTPSADSSKVVTHGPGQVKPIGTQYFNHAVFHGGMPQLYHRHVNQMIVRGDSVVLISLKK